MMILQLRFQPREEVEIARS